MTTTEEGLVRLEDVDVDALANLIASIKQGESETPRCEPPGAYEIEVARGWAVRTLKAIRALPRPPRTAPSDGEVKLRSALRAHHNWHMEQGLCWAPTDEDDDAGFVSWSGSDAYAESSLCEETIAALALPHPTSEDSHE